jgi:phosphosulfolactate synthase
MRDYAFAAIPMLERPAKPRSAGQTMMIDFGLGLGQQEDILRLAGAYIDSAKIAVGVARLLPRELVMQKIALYRTYDVVPYPGGQFLEYAVLCEKVYEFLAEAQAVGFPAIEVSDNLLSISLAEKQGLIRKAREEYGLEVYGEVGKKEGLAVTVSLEEDIEACLAAGSSKVLVEAAEIFSHGRDKSLAMQLTAAAPLEKLMFELTGPWIDGTAYAEPDSLARWLMQTFGPDVNIGNVQPESLLRLETARRSLGVNAGGELPAGLADDATLDQE